MVIYELLSGIGSSSAARPAAVGLVVIAVVCYFAKSKKVGSFPYDLNNWIVSIIPP